MEMVIPTGIEPVTYRLGICRSILLSYGTTRPTHNRFGSFRQEALCTQSIGFDNGR